MTFYDGIYPFYSLQRSPFIIDISLLVAILVFSVLAVSFIFILPGIRGKSVRERDLEHYSKNNRAL